MRSGEAVALVKHCGAEGGGEATKRARRRECAIALLKARRWGGSLCPERVRSAPQIVVWRYAERWSSSPEGRTSQQAAKQPSGASRAWAFGSVKLLNPSGYPFRDGDATHRAATQRLTPQARLAHAEPSSASFLAQSPWVFDLLALTGLGARTRRSRHSSANNEAIGF